MDSGKAMHWFASAGPGDTVKARVSVLPQLSGSLGEPGLGGGNTGCIHFFWIQMNLQLDKAVFPSTPVIRTAMVKSGGICKLWTITGAFHII